MRVVPCPRLARIATRKHEHAIIDGVQTEPDDFVKRRHAVTKVAECHGVGPQHGLDRQFGCECSQRVAKAVQTRVGAPLEHVIDQHDSHRRGGEKSADRRPHRRWHVLHELASFRVLSGGLFHGSAPQPTAFAFSRTRRRRHVPATVARPRPGTQFTWLGPRAVNRSSWYSPGWATTLARCSRHSSRYHAGSSASPHCRASPSR